jgi:hypothetical protein
LSLSAFSLRELSVHRKYTPTIRGKAAAAQPQFVTRTLKRGLERLRNTPKSLIFFPSPAAASMAHALLFSKIRHGARRAGQTEVEAVLADVEEVGSYGRPGS